MILLHKKLIIRGGSIYQPNEFYSGPHEQYAIDRGLGERVNRKQSGQEGGKEGEGAKAPSSPKEHKQIQHPRHKKRGQRKGQ